MADDLIGRARQGDEAALRRLYETHRSRVMRLAFGLLGNADDAEDIMQDVMVYALRHLDRYDEDRAAFGTWLHVMTVNRCRDRQRRKRLGFDRLAQWLRDERTTKPTDPDDRLGGIDAAARIGQALQSLTDIQREAVVLRHLEGLSYREIGEVLGVPMRTAQTRVVSGHAALRRVLEMDDPVAGDSVERMDAPDKARGQEHTWDAGGRAGPEGRDDV